MFIFIILYQICFCSAQTTVETESTLFCQTSSDCNYKGDCLTGENRCSCYSQYSGLNCSQCAAGFFNYPSCYDCSTCEQNHGTCNNVSDTCVCQYPDRFTGTFCDQCQPNFYGSNCTNDPMVWYVTPNQVTDIDARDGIDILITGNNFTAQSIANVLCYFHGQTNLTIQASSLNDTAIVCHLKNYASIYNHYVQISVSLDNGISWLKGLNDGSVYLYIFSNCVNKTCISGYCSYGQCICYSGSIGIECDQCIDGYFRTSYGTCWNCATDCNSVANCTNQTCVCPEGFQGDGCQNCIEHHYGSNCLQYPVIQTVSPSWITDYDARDGIDLTVTVDNINITNFSSIICSFKATRSWGVPASAANETTITCHLSNHTEYNSQIEIQVSLDNGNTWLQWQGRSVNKLYISPQCGVDRCISGYCRFNSCICNDGAFGSMCDQCIEGYFRTSYGTCLNCATSCNPNGMCTNHTCICPERFQGDGCYNCIAHHYGLDCLQYPVIQTVNPSWITDFDARDGIDLTVTVDNINITNFSSVLCSFQTSYNWTVPASAANGTTITCRLFNHTEYYPSIQIRVSLDNGTTWLEWQSRYLNYLQISSQCTWGGCVHGYCHFNRCVCYEGAFERMCDQCIEGYFHTSWRACWNCLTNCNRNATCTNQKCICPDNFAGEGCNDCATHYYGVDCLESPAIQTVNPTWVTDFAARDGIDLTVTVDNINITDFSSVLCSFQARYNWIVPASAVNETTITCRLSNHTEYYTSIQIQVSLDNGTTWLQWQNRYSNYLYIQSQCGWQGCNNGYCHFNRCICYPGASGPTCKQCDQDYFLSSYGSCLKCSDYCANNGLCSSQGCVCQGRFTGFGCRSCIEHHYGPDCLPDSVILSVTPNWITDTASRDGIYITINGDNFGGINVSQVVCRFQGSTNSIVHASEITATTVTCQLSNYTDSTTIQTSISFDSGVSWLSFQNSYNSYINIYPDCGSNICTYGRCSYGSCLCGSQGNKLQVSPFRGSMYGGYPLRIYGMCFNELGNKVYINDEQINDCRWENMVIICTMPMQQEGRLKIQVFNSGNLVGETYFVSFVPEDDASIILVNGLELANRIRTENDGNITLHFLSNYFTENYLFTVTLFDYSTIFSMNGEIKANYSRRHIDLGLELMDLSVIQNFKIPYDLFVSNNASENIFHSLVVRFEMVSNESGSSNVVLQAMHTTIRFIEKFTPQTVCNSWLAQQSDKQTERFIEMIPACPARVRTTWPRQSISFSIDPTCDGLKRDPNNCIYQRGAAGCYIGPSVRSDAGAQCCYNSLGYWIDDWRYGAGSINAISPASSVLGHYLTDVIPYLACCYSAGVSSTSCQNYMKYRPRGNVIQTILVPIGGSGDPHFNILNGQSYTFNGHGEYVLLKVSTISLQIQVRLGAMITNSTDASDTATSIIAFVAQAENYSKVQFDLDYQSKTVNIRIDGRLLDSSNITSINDSLSSSSILFSDDQQLIIRRTNSTKYQISLGLTGVDIDVNIRPQFDFLDLPIVIPQSILENATCQGLLGDLQGLAYPNGTRVTTGLDDEKAMFDYGESWRLTENSTLFTYALFDSFAQRQDFTYQPVFRDDLFKKYNQTDEYRTAEQTCQNVAKRDECIYDVLVMKDPTVVVMQQTYEEHKREIQVLNEATEATTETTQTPATSEQSSSSTTATSTQGSSSTIATSTQGSSSTIATSTQSSSSTTATSTQSSSSTTATSTQSSSSTTATSTQSSSSTTATSTQSSSSTTATSTQSSSSTIATQTSPSASSVSNGSPSSSTIAATISNEIMSSATNSPSTNSVSSSATTTQVLIELIPLSDYCQ